VLAITFEFLCLAFSDLAEVNDLVCHFTGPFLLGVKATSPNLRGATILIDYPYAWAARHRRRSIPAARLASVVPFAAHDG
jgi:hypothetical protein